jgi:hypothetical protein
VAKRQSAKRRPRTTAETRTGDIAVKKKLMLLAGKASVQHVLSLAPEDIRVEPVETRRMSSRLITGRGNNIVWGDMDPRDSIRILDTDPEDRVIRVDFDPKDPIHP